MKCAYKYECNIYVEQNIFKEPRGPRAIEAVRELNKTGLNKSKQQSIDEVVKRGPGLHVFHFYAYALAYRHVKLGCMYATGHTHTADTTIYTYIYLKETRVHKRIHKLKKQHRWYYIFIYI